jgi:hypothetical protein
MTGSAAPPRRARAQFISSSLSAAVYRRNGQKRLAIGVTSPGSFFLHVSAFALIFADIYKYYMKCQGGLIR